MLISGDLVIHSFSLLLLQCGLALHRKCMESCQLECEHRKGTVFGVDLSAITRDKQDEVPFVVLQCTSEIEHRALSVQVLFITAMTRVVGGNQYMPSWPVCYCGLCLRGCIVLVGPSRGSKSSARPLKHKRKRWTCLSIHRMISPLFLNSSLRRYGSCGRVIALNFL